MVYTCKYSSPLGDILLAADEVGLTGLWFEGQKYFANTLPDEQISQETHILAEAKKWLDIYFSGNDPDFTPPLHPTGSTFQTFSLEDLITDSIRKDDHIRRDRAQNRWFKGCFRYVCSGSRRRSRT